MTEKLLYGHTVSGSETGYRVLARSPSTSPVSELDVNRLIQSLRLRPTDLGENAGWFWLRFSQTIRVFARAHVCTRQSGVNTLQFRFIFFDNAECESFAWQPFCFLDEMNDGGYWEPDENDALPQLRDIASHAETPPHDVEPMVSFSLDWRCVGSAAGSVFSAFVDSLPVSSRSDVEFLAPDLADRNRPILIFRTTINETIASNATPVVRRSSAEQSHRISSLFVYSAVAVAVVAAISAAITSACWRDEIKRLNGEISVREQQLVQLERPAVDEVSKQGLPELPIADTASSNQFAKRVREQLRKLFGELNQSDNSLTVRSDGTNIVVHYLDNKYESSDEMALVENALREWLSIEQRKSSELTRMSKANKIIGDLNKNLNGILQLFQRIDDKRMDRLSTSPQENLEEIDRTLEEVRRLIQQFRNQMPLPHQQ